VSNNKAAGTTLSGQVGLSSEEMPDLTGGPASGLAGLRRPALRCLLLFLLFTVSGRWPHAKW